MQHILRQTLLGTQSNQQWHYDDVIMGAMAFQTTSLTIVYSTVYSGADQRKHQSSASLAFVRGIHRWPVNSPHKGPVTRKMFPFDDVIMVSIFSGGLFGSWQVTTKAEPGYGKRNRTLIMIYLYIKKIIVYMNTSLISINWIIDTNKSWWKSYFASHMNQNCPSSSTPTCVPWQAPSRNAFSEPHSLSRMTLHLIICMGFLLD